MSDPIDRSLASTPSALRRALVKDEVSIFDLTDQVIVGEELPASECGAFAQIFEGTHQKDGKVAVKLLSMRNGDGDTLEKDIARELLTWCKLKHDNILPFHGYIMRGKYPALVSVWMVDGSLWKYMRAGKLDRRGAMSMIRGVASGLSYMHKKDAIHADIKSDNVLISPECQALLTDFGISRMIGLTRGCTTDLLGGSDRWLAKELFSSQDTHTKETDVWAFGMTVYETLACKRPYHSVDPGLIQSYIENDILPTKPANSVDHNLAEIEEFMWSLCERCWAEAPELRPSMETIETEVRQKCAQLRIL